MSNLEPDINDTLKGIRILDFTHFVAGPTCSMLLGDLGADVIKIESLSGDYLRNIPPFIMQESLVMMSVNRNKRSLVIDFKKAEGVMLVKRLVLSADILLENFRPGIMDNLGIGYNEIKKLNTRIIYGSISGFGQEGPCKHKPAVDLIIQALSGMIRNSSTADIPPTTQNIPIIDITSGLMLTTLVLAALRKRDLTGRGQHLDVAMYNTALMLQQLSLTIYMATGEKWKIGAPYHVVPTKDHWIVIVAYDDYRWQRLCHVLGNPDLAVHKDFISYEKRAENNLAVVKEITRLLANKTSAEWLVLMEAEDILCAPVLEYEDVLSSSQLANNNIIVESQHSVAGPVRMVGMAAGDNNVQSRVRCGPPTLGEHTSEILKEFGLLSEEIAALIENGTIMQM